MKREEIKDLEFKFKKLKIIDLPIPMKLHITQTKNQIVAIYSTYISYLTK